jgi:hypothetical protein
MLSVNELSEQAIDLVNTRNINEEKFSQITTASGETITTVSQLLNLLNSNNKYFMQKGLAIFIEYHACLFGIAVEREFFYFFKKFKAQVLAILAKDQLGDKITLSNEVVIAYDDDELDNGVLVVFENKIAFIEKGNIHSLDGKIRYHNYRLFPALKEELIYVVGKLTDDFLTYISE